MVKKCKVYLQSVKKFLVSINRPQTVTQIFRKAGLHYSSVIRISRILEESGFIESKKVGRVRIIVLTNDGIKLKRILSKLRD